MKDFYSRSEDILKPGFIESEFDNFADCTGLFYLGALAGLGRVLGKLDRILNGLITRRIYSRDRLNMVQNFVECETHRELLLRYLNLKRRK